MKISTKTGKFVKLVIRDSIQRVLGSKYGSVSRGEELRVVLTDDRSG